MQDAPSFKQQLAAAEKTFVATVSEAILQQQQMTRDEAQAGLSFTLCGAWNELERVTFALPIRREK